MKKVLIILFPFVIGIMGFVLYSLFRYPTTDPFHVAQFYFERVVHPHKTMKQQIIAFLPYWRIDDTKYTKFDLLSEINYFALNIDQNGDFIKRSGNQTDPGWREWNNQTVKDLIAH